MEIMILGILQARVSSSRLPGKVLKSILGEPMLLRQIERILRAKKIDKLLVATSIDSSDDPIEACCHENNIECFRGNLDDVLDRFYQAAKVFKPEHVVRFTGDCPLIDPQIVDRLVTLHLYGGFDYTTLSNPPSFPDGLDTEAIYYPTLEQVWREAFLPSQREHVTLFIYQNPQKFVLGNLENIEDLSKMRWTVDQQEDFDLVTKIYEALYPKNPNFLMQDVLDFLNFNPCFVAMNRKYQYNEGLLKSFEKDQVYLRNKEEKPNG